MPPKAKISKHMILNAVLDLTRETGFETVNARSIADKLTCSTRPIFTCYENMEELKHEFLAYAYEYFEQYVTDYRDSTNIAPSLIHPLSYIDFARNETELFRLLFINDIDLNMTAAGDFYKERDNEMRAAAFAETIGVELERAKVIFLDLFFYSHGIAVLTAAKKIALDTNRAKTMLENILSALIEQENTNPAKGVGNENKSVFD